MDHLEPTDFATLGNVVQIGIEPIRVDIITNIEPLDFKTAAARAMRVPFGKAFMRIVGKEDLIAPKMHANRPQDRKDLRALLPKGTKLPPAKTKKQ